MSIQCCNHILLLIIINTETIDDKWGSVRTIYGELMRQEIILFLPVFRLNIHLVEDLLSY